MTKETLFLVVGVYLGMTISFGFWMIGRFLKARNMAKKAPEAPGILYPIKRDMNYEMLRSARIKQLIEKAPVSAEANSPVV